MEFSWYSFMLQSIDAVAGWMKLMKNSSDAFGNQTRKLPACSDVPQPTAPPRDTKS
jgi:hypothetical protein